VLVVEDIHWATPPTLALLTHLVRSGEPGRLLLVVNYRDTALDVTPALADAVADLLRQPDVDRLSLTGFDRDGVSAYLQARAGGEFDRAGPQLAERLHAETAGDPYYLSELLRHLGETGALTEGGWAAAADGGSGVPESVRDVIARRVSRLPDATRDVLALAAIQGDRFDPTVLAEASDLPTSTCWRPSTLPAPPGWSPRPTGRRRDIASCTHWSGTPCPTGSVPPDACSCIEPPALPWPR
jgi:predicted ATPase